MLTLVACASFLLGALLMMRYMRREAIEHDVAYIDEEQNFCYKLSREFRLVNLDDLEPREEATQEDVDFHRLYDLQPVLLQVTNEGYKIVNGDRTISAMKKLGKRKVAALIEVR